MQYAKKANKVKLPMSLIAGIDEDYCYHLKVQIFHCLSPESFYRQDHEKNHALPTNYRSNKHKKRRNKQQT